MVKIAVVADVHLRPRTWADRPELVGDSIEAWKYVIEWCVANGCEAMFSLGDLFNSKTPDVASVAAFMAGMRRLQEAGVGFFYIQGNHDYSEPPWPSVLSSHAVHMHGVVKRFNGLGVAGLDSTPTSQVRPEIFPTGFDVLLAHQAWTELQGVGNTASVRAIPHSCYLLTGDYHVTTTFGGTAFDGGAIQGFSPGATSMQRMSESADKFFLLLQPDLSIGAIPIPGRRVIRLDAETPEQFTATLVELDKQLTDLGGQVLGLPETLQKPIVEVRFNSGIEEARSRLLSVIRDRAFLFDKPRLGTAVNEPTTAGGGVGSPMDRLLQKVSQCEDPQARDMLRDVLSAESRRPMVESWRKRVVQS